MHFILRATKIRVRQNLISNSKRKKHLRSFHVILQAAAVDKNQAKRRNTPKQVA